MQAKILVVDDDPDILLSLENRVAHLGHEPLTASNGKDALRVIKEEEPDVVLLDLKLPDLHGMEILKRIQGSIPSPIAPENVAKIHGRSAPPRVIILTAFGSIEMAVQAMQQGAFDFIPKPFTADHLNVVIKKALDDVAVTRHIDRLHKEVDAQFDPIVASNAQMHVQLARAKKAAASTATILLLGETGTGKEVLARAVHRWSPRSHKPFIPVNCAAIPEALIESELFGHEKYAYTDAKTLKRGQFEEADSGTLFLDEIGDMSLSTQAKVLRALNDQQFTRVGGTKPIRVDVRVIAATNKDLQQAVRQGIFREDLYFRLAVITVTPPPLRDRMDDLHALAEHFAKSRPRKLGLHKRYTFSDAAMDALQRYTWPGNIRELENVISRALVLCAGDRIEPDDLLLPDSLEPEPSIEEAPIQSEGDPLAHSYHERMKVHSRSIIEHALRMNGWNQTKTAQYLGLQRTFLTKLLKKKQIPGRPPTSSVI